MVLSGSARAAALSFDHARPEHFAYDKTGEGQLSGCYPTLSLGHDLQRRFEPYAHRQCVAPVAIRVADVLQIRLQSQPLTELHGIE